MHPRTGATTYQGHGTRHKDPAERNAVLNQEEQDFINLIKEIEHLSDIQLKNVI